MPKKRVVFGDQFNYETVDIYDLVVLPQVRKKPNSKIPEIAKSIMVRNIINKIDVAKLTYEELHRKETKAKRKQAMQDLTSKPFEYYINFFQLDSNLTGEDHAEDIQHIKRLYRQYFNERYFKKP